MHLSVSLAAGFAVMLLASDPTATDPDKTAKQTAKHSDAVHWSYTGPGDPAHWADIAPEFAPCRTGMMQSPIDLNTVSAHADIPVTTDYKAGPLTILNNGHTVQANFAPGSQMWSSGAEFGLLQVHFHTASEHVTSGKHYPLEAHFVHKNANGQLAVLGIFFEEGAANPELAKLIAAAPKHEQAAHEVPGVTFDPVGLLPKTLNVYRYMGSLTTPPCSEGVNWHVAATPMTASAEQIAALHAIMGDNARPVQPLNNRLLVSR